MTFGRKITSTMDKPDGAASLAGMRNFSLAPSPSARAQGSN